MQLRALPGIGTPWAGCYFRGFTVRCSVWGHLASSFSSLIFVLGMSRFDAWDFAAIVVSLLATMGFLVLFSQDSKAVFHMFLV